MPGHTLSLDAKQRSNYGISCTQPDFGGFLWDLHSRQALVFTESTVFNGIQILVEGDRLCAGAPKCAVSND